MEPSLTSIVTRAQAGDRDAWDQIISRMENMVWSVVRSHRLSHADAADVAQLIWLRTIERLSTVRDPERLGLWIATLARRECRRYIERSARITPADPHTRFSHLASNEDVQTSAANRSEAKRIIDALARLDERCQSLLRLVLCDPPMRYREIAEALGIAVGTIGARRARCLSELRAAAGV